MFRVAVLFLLVANPIDVPALYGQVVPMVSTIRIFLPTITRSQLEQAILLLDRNRFLSQYQSHFVSRIVNKEKPYLLYRNELM